MNFRKISTIIIGVGLLAGAMTVIGLGSAKAAQIPYVSGQPLPSIKTPVFNTFTNVPAGVGNEADFVKLRKSNGTSTTPAGRSPYADPVNAACTVGEKFDVSTYVHNGADADYNANGRGTAVARDTVVRLSAPLNATSSKFTFNSSVSASNAQTVIDAGTLNCQNNVKLRLVPKSVSVYSKFYGWKNVADSAVNGTLKIGSRELGSGAVWGCWEDTVMVVYTVEVVKKPIASSAVCEDLRYVIHNKREVEATVVTRTQNATIIAYRIDWGDGSFSNVRNAKHTYNRSGNFTVTGSFRVRYDSGKTEWKTSDDCKEKLTFHTDKEVCPIPGKEHLPLGECVQDEAPRPQTPPAPEVKASVTTLPETGVGTVAGMLASTSIAGTIAHRLVYGRRRH